MAPLFVISPSTLLSTRLSRHCTVNARIASLLCLLALAGIELRFASTGLSNSPNWSGEVPDYTFAANDPPPAEAATPPATAVLPLSTAASAATSPHTPDTRRLQAKAWFEAARHEAESVQDAPVKGLCPAFSGQRAGLHGRFHGGVPDGPVHRNRPRQNRRPSMPSRPHKPGRASSRRRSRRPRSSITTL